MEKFGDDSAVDSLGASAVRRLIAEYGGTSYSEGLYWILTADDAQRWTGILRRFFPSQSKGAEAFGRDWQGNIFGYRERGAPCVFLFQPGTGDVFEVAESIVQFHEEELTDHAEEALSFSLWKGWRSTNPPLGPNQCVAYKQPIFLGGDVAVENLTIADINVYWEVVGQLLGQIRTLPVGTPIRRVSLAYLDED